MKTVNVLLLAIWLQSLSLVCASNVTLLDTTQQTTDNLLSWNVHPQNTWTVVTLPASDGAPYPIFSSVCDKLVGQTGWLQSPLISAANVNRYHVETLFSMRECSYIPSLSNCKQFFNVYFVEATNGTAPSLPPDSNRLKQVYPSSNVYADQYTQRSQNFLIGGVLSDVPVSSPGTGFYLLFQVPTTCVSLTSITVYYSVCDAVKFNLVQLPSMHTGRTIEYPFPSAPPSCVPNAIWNNSVSPSQNAYSFMCIKSGVWVNSVSQVALNVSNSGLVLNANRFLVPCSCQLGFAPDSQYTTCLACPLNSYKNWIGNDRCSSCPSNSLTNQVASTWCACAPNFYRAPNEPISAPCTSTPSAPNQLAYATQSGGAALKLSWFPPTSNGGRTDIYYTISFIDGQTGETNQGLYLSGHATSAAQALGLSYAFATNETSVQVLGIISSHTYNFTVQSWNGVSSLALLTGQIIKNAASVVLTAAAPLPCALEGVNFVTAGSGQASVSWSPSSASFACQNGQMSNSISLFEIRVWSQTAQRRRKRSASQQLISVQYESAHNSSLNIVIQLPPDQSEYSVQTRALIGNSWTSLSQQVVLKSSHLASSDTTHATAQLQLSDVAQSGSSVIGISVGVTVAVLLVVSMVSAFFIVHRKRYRRRKCAAEFHKFKRTSDDHISASSGSSRSNSSQQAAVIIGPPQSAPRPVADSKPCSPPGRICNDELHCPAGNSPRESHASHNYICGLIDSNTTMSTTLPNTSSTLFGHNSTMNSAPETPTTIVSCDIEPAPQGNDVCMHEACSCSPNQFPGTHTNSAFRVYVDPHAYEDPHVLIRAFATELDVHSIVLEKVIGSGEFGDVCFGRLNVAMNIGRTRLRAAYNSGESSIPVAVKTLKQEHKTEKSRLDFLLEASILGQFEHPNILRLIGVVTRAHPTMIVTEFMQNGSLDGFLRAHRASRTFTVRQRASMLFDVVNGMKYLADRGVIHRDLAARNILVDQNLACKVSDFGLSRKLHSSSCKNQNSVTIDETVYRARGGKIPVRWTAPEAIQYRTFNYACDVWSFGVLSWETLLYGERPYWNWSNHDALSAVSNGFRLPRLDDVPDVLYTMMLECWQINPQDRPTFADLFEYFSELRKHDDGVFLEEVSVSSSVERDCVCRESWWTIQNIVSQHEANADRRGKRPNEILLTESEIEYLNYLSRQTCIQHWLYTMNLQRYASDFEEKARVSTVEQLCTAVNEWGSVRGIGLALPAEYEEAVCSALQRWWQANSDSSSSARSVQSPSVASADRPATLNVGSRIRANNQPCTFGPNAGSFV